MGRILAGRGRGREELLRGGCRVSLIGVALAGEFAGFCSLMETSGFPLFDVPLAGSRPGGRVTSLRRQRSNQERRPRFTGPWLKLSLDPRTPLRCSHRAAVAELARCAGSDSCAGRPRPLLRCSAAQKGLFGTAARFRPFMCDRRQGSKWGEGKVWSVLACRSAQPFK